MGTFFRSDAYIDGQWRASDQRFAVRNPATLEKLAEVADLGPAETEEAVAAAHRALGAWSAMTANERATILRGWRDLMIAEVESLARLITLEGGKPLAEARAEAVYAASYVDWFAEEAKRAYGRTVPATVQTRRYVTIKQPVGVCAAITPWNFPMAMIARKAGPALAAGCTMVLKPPAQTPLTALALAELAERAGVPAGVFNVVTTERASEVGRVLCESPLVRKFSFTGSTAVGKRLGAACVGSTAKRVSLELGGNAPLLVFADADLDRAVAGVLASKFRNAGQTCVCANRVLVHDAVYDAFSRRLSEVVSKLRVGDGSQTDTQIGPLIDAAAIEKVERMVAEAVAAGAVALTGGTRHQAGAQFYAPTVLTSVTRSMRVNTEEIFGPVAPLAAAMLAGALINALIYYSGSTLDFYSSIAPPILAAAIVPVASQGVQDMPWVIAPILCVTILRMRRAREELTALFGSIDQLTAARTEAEQTSRVKSQVMATFSHELRTPLNAVINYAEMLQEELEFEQRTVFAQDAARIRRAGRGLLAMVERILDYTMLETEQVHLKIASVALLPVLAELVEEARALAEARDNRSSLSVEGAIVSVQTDEVRFRQCVRELLDNACKYTQGGQISVRAQTALNHCGEDAVEILIEDSGCGMSSEQASLVLHHLVQADGSLTRKQDGLGIGLAIAQRVVALMRADIEIKSAPGAGTTVKLVVPRQHAGAARAVEVQAS